MPGRGPLLGRLAVVAVLALMVALPTVGAPAARGTVGPAREIVLSLPGTAGFHASVTWNGADVSTAGTISSAISTAFGSTIDLHYTWSFTTGGIGPIVKAFNISDARLQMFYFGFPLATRDVVDSNPQLASNGTFDMSWDPGVLQWVLAGIYGLTASLIATNGTTIWSEPFYVHVSAPGGVGAVLPILLILIGIYEIYELARAGRQAAPTPSKQSAGSPPTGPSKPPGAGTEAPPKESAPAEPSPAPPKEGT